MNQHHEHNDSSKPKLPADENRHGGRVRAAWDAVLGVLGTAFGLLPHVLHHAGPLAGTVLVAGAGGTILFSVLALVVSIPFLLRLRRRFGTWRAPAIGLGVFTAMFALSTFVIGPAIRDGGDDYPSEHDPVQHQQHQ
jgi:hypothetical protein